MSDQTTDSSTAPENSGGTSAETPAPESTQPANGAETTDPGATETDGSGEQHDETALPDWARAELTSVRKEAAKYRVAAKELRESLAQAKDPEDFEAATARVAELETELHRERLARKYRLPDVLAARVTGETDEERDADAKALAEAFHTRTVGLGKGGLDPNAKLTPKDPAALAALVRRRRS